MIEDIVAKVVMDHYEPPGAPVLLMSDLGTALIGAGHWPAPHESRTLLDVVEQTPGLSLVRDDNSPSYIAITIKGDERRAEIAIGERTRRRFLAGLARPVLIAFTIELFENQPISLKLEPKVTFHTESEPPPEAIVVDADLRLPGLTVSDLGETATRDIERLEISIRTWCDRHAIPLAALSKAKRSAVRAPSQTSPVVTGPASALERLYAAQPAEIVSRLAIPMDIALALSRMP